MLSYYDGILRNVFFIGNIIGNLQNIKQFSYLLLNIDVRMNEQMEFN